VSKVIKQMEMDALKKTFQDVRDLVVLSVKGLDCRGEHGLRVAMRKRNVRLQVVKNSLTRRVFNELGLRVGDDSPYWLGPTMLAWGTDSLGELSRAIDAELKNAKTAALYKDKVIIKGAIIDGQPFGFEQAVKMPTRAEAIAAVVAAILGPGGAVAGCLSGPAAQVASQIQSISERKEEPAPAATPA
jgi:large subunit ribosomal protein L10